VPIFGLVTAFVLFIRTFFEAGRRWLAAATIVVRGVASLVVNFVHSPSLNYDAITGLRRVRFLGDEITVANGASSEWTRLGELSSLLLLAFLVDVTWTVWRRGDRRRAALVGGSALLFVLISVVNSALIHSNRVAAPYLISVPFFVMLVAMTYEVAADFRNASELSRRLNDAESALEESERRLGLAADAAAVGLWTWDVARDEIWMTPRGHALHGFPAGERLSLRAFLSSIHPEDRKRIRKAIDRLVASGREIEGEFRVVLPEGEIRWIGLRGLLERDPSGNPSLVRGVSIDVSRRKVAEGELNRRQAELAHLSRVSMLGELSGSLAHELNQPLTAILSNAQAAQRFLANGESSGAEIREILGEIVAEGKRAGEVIRRLRALLQRGELHREPVELPDVVSDVLALLHSELVRHGVSVATDIAGAVPAVRADRVQIEQVLLNLITNACDAMAQQENADKRLLVRAECANGEGICVSIVDRGCGLPAEDLERVFQPFVTTKARGMGLGLAVCRTIIVAHGGRLWATRNDDRGATFQFTLPTSDESPS
jgi:PAS domain S-box-containing protein